MHVPEHPSHGQALHEHEHGKATETVSGEKIM